MNLALNWVADLSVLVILKLIVEVTRRFDYISMISSGYGSVPYKNSLYLHLELSFRITTKSKDTFPGFIGLKIN